MTLMFSVDEARCLFDTVRLFSIRQVCVWIVGCCNSPTSSKKTLLSHCIIYINGFIHEKVGNKKFRALISAALDEYMCCNMTANARDKSRTVGKVVGQVQATGGRFMRRDVQGAIWYELTRRKAREKVIHALRQQRSICTKPKSPEVTVSKIVQQTCQQIIYCHKSHDGRDDRRNEGLSRQQTR
jgi:hypothetical protein